MARGHINRVTGSTLIADWEAFQLHPRVQGENISKFECIVFYITYTCSIMSLTELSKLFTKLCFLFRWRTSQEWALKRKGTFSFMMELLGTNLDPLDGTGWTIHCWLRCWRYWLATRNGWWWIGLTTWSGLFAACCGSDSCWSPTSQGILPILTTNLWANV